MADSDNDAPTTGGESIKVVMRFRGNEGGEKKAPWVFEEGMTCFKSLCEVLICKDSS